MSVHAELRLTEHTAHALFLQQVVDVLSDHRQVQLTGRESRKHIASDLRFLILLLSHMMYIFMTSWLDDQHLFTDFPNENIQKWPNIKEQVHGGLNHWKRNLQIYFCYNISLDN